MRSIKQHLITERHSVKEVLGLLDVLALDAILFLVDEQGRLEGSLTDGDIRRGLIKGLGLGDEIRKYVRGNPKFFRSGQFNLSQMKDWRDRNFKIIPVIDGKDRLVDIVNFRLQKSYLPMDAVIMAGGEGTRLRPLTLDTPKPLLKIGGKPIVEYNLDTLKTYGLRNITFTIKYLGEQIIDYFGNGGDRDLNIGYVEEIEPLGTIGSVRLVKQLHNDYVLVMNSDLLTNISYEDMFSVFLEKDADMIVATTPYEVNVPYGVIETQGDRIVGLTEKPTYTYYSNAGIYIFKSELVNLIPRDKLYNATDLMEALYSSNKKVVHYPIVDYWLDIGKPHDFEKAQVDVKHIKF